MHAISDVLPKTDALLLRCGRPVRTLRGCVGMQQVKESDGDKDYTFFIDPSTGEYVAGSWQCSRCNFYFPDMHADEGKRPFEYITENGTALSFCAPCHPLWRKEVYEPRINGQRALLQVPMEYLAASPADLPKPIRDLVLSWPQQRFVMLIGECGRGKTHAMWVSAKGASEKGLSVTVKHVPAMRSNWIASERRDEMERAWINAPLLMLDDLTSGAASDGWLEAIRMVINDRIAREMPTFITSSAIPRDIGKAFGPAFESRLHRFKVLTVLGDDRRKPN